MKYETVSMKLTVLNSECRNDEHSLRTKQIVQKGSFKKCNLLRRRGYLLKRCQSVTQARERVYVNSEVNCFKKQRLKIAFQFKPLCRNFIDCLTYLSPILQNLTLLSKLILGVTSGKEVQNESNHVLLKVQGGHTLATY